MPETVTSSREQIIVISTPAELEVGQAVESLSEIPHLTLFPWVTIDKSQWGVFDQRMSAARDVTLARNMVGLDRVNFGTEEKPHYVRRLYGLDVDLRVDIANIAIDLNGTYDPRFAEWDTEAHVSETESYAMQEGEVWQIDRMIAIARDLGESQKVVRAIYKWARPSKWYL